ncbi:transmembrane protein 33 isoform X2 [Hippopotamus amphibius kiboko]|uniref:transmembrane protein 33 isoform X2 n=1 Tax=Hippopotamus amphibius kiboko TaxID=575201 RepID=UPI002594CCC5|nr:transmembrane protein 33 isoform X2 [Hippopotamus amphibius kiboko]
MADTAPNSPQAAGAVQFMMANKLDTAMWLSRLFTVYCSALFVLPLLGLHEAASFYQRALLANALTSALRLHQRLPHFQLSRAFLAQALLEDSCHYLLYSLIFVNSYPVTMSIFPVLLFSLLHAATYTKKVLDAKGSNSLPLLRSLLDKLSSNQQNILKFIACNEIFLMPATVFMLFRFLERCPRDCYDFEGGTWIMENLFSIEYSFLLTFSLWSRKFVPAFYIL